MPSPYLPDWLAEQAARAPGAPALDTPTVRLTYGQLQARVERLAGHFAARGIGRGDRVLVALPNAPAAVVVSLALQARAAVPLEAPRTWGRPALAGIAARAGVRGAVVTVEDARPGEDSALSWPLEHLWLVAGPGRHIADAGRPGRLPAVRIEADGSLDPAADQLPASPGRPTDRRPDDPALILYTSGSTGTPRGVIQTYRNIGANTRSIVEYLRLTAVDRALLTLPLSYCYGRSVLQTHLLVGGSVFLEPRSAFPRVVMETLAAEGCTGFAGVPLTFEILRRQVDIASLEFPRLRYLAQAGGPMAPDTIAWVRAAFRPARLFVMYGQTEATARLSWLPPEMGEAKHGSIGIAIPGVELRVVDADGAEVASGVVGELVARGANVTPGYLDEPAATEALVVDGWLRTGDLALRDADGYFFLRGRTKEMLKIGGHRVSPVEIEQVINGDPAVAEVAVVGRRDGLMGEVSVAVVVLRPGGTLDAAALRRRCQERLPAHAVPVAYLAAAGLPRNEAGKLLREEVAAQFAEEPAGGARAIASERTGPAGDARAAAGDPA